MKKILSGALLAVLFGSGTAFASDNTDSLTGRASLGYSGVFAGDFMQGISSRYWFSDNIGGELNLFYGGVGVEVNGVDEGELDLLYGSAKLLYAPVVNQNSRFYVGIEGGYGDFGGLGEEVDASVYTVSPFIGTEFRFTEIPNIAFNWEVGYEFHNISADVDSADVDISMGGTSVTVGAHYYF